MHDSFQDLPPPLRGIDPDSFAHHTVTVRWPRIARRVLDHNAYPKSIAHEVRELIEEIPGGPIRPLDDPTAPDEGLWNEWIEPYVGQTWLEVPWFFGETYFYRRILEATGYFRAGSGWHDDPFSAEKKRAFEEAQDGIRSLARAHGVSEEERGSRAELTRLLRTALWGNQADLSMWAADEEGPNHLEGGDEHEHVLVDDADRALQYLSALGRPARIDLWVDNAGFELVTDLALADGLLATVADPVVLHMKAHPTFVSDATVSDVHATVDALKTDSAQPVCALANRLGDALSEGRLRVSDALAWTSPLPARTFPSTVRAEIARSDLLISKGDANYRRLLGDRHWPFTTPFEEVVSYMPVPVLALRTLKAEVAAGLTEQQVAEVRQMDPDWLTSGEWGVLQFAPTRHP